MSALPVHAVELEGLTKHFTARGIDENGGRRRAVRRLITAVDHVDLQIPRGELFGLLGPNGAGKTTTIRMICTLLEPTSGRVRVWSHDASKTPASVRRNLGVLLMGERSVYWKLSARENLEYFAALYQVPAATAKARISELLDRVGLTARADDLVERYSTGMRQRLALIKSMVHDPPVLLLDEPTTGLDPQAARNIRDLIRHLHSEGKTIILTTHYMEEADQLCERIGIIDYGKIIALDAPQTLKRVHGEQPVLRLDLEDITDGVEPALREIPGVTRVVVQPKGANGGGYEAIVHLSDLRETLPRAVETVSRAGGRVRHLQLVETTLEDVFIALTGRTLRD